MSFFQKNKSILVILLMVGFFVAILVTFVSGISGSKSDPTPTGSVLSELPVLATSTGNVTSSAPRPSGTQLPPVTPMNTNASTGSTPTVAAPQNVGSPPPTVKSSVTEVPPGTNAPPPPTFVITDTGPLGTDFPPPPTFIPLKTETPPPGNGDPPGS